MAMPLLFAVDWFRSGCCSGQREFKGNVLEAAGKDFLSKLKEGKPSEKIVCSDLYLQTFNGIVMPGAAASMSGPCNCRPGYEGLTLADSMEL